METSARKSARILGNKRYIDSSERCVMCGGDEFYTVNGQCVGCTISRAKARYSTPEGRERQNSGDRRRYRERKAGDR